MFSETDIMKMFLIDNIFAMFGGRALPQTVCILAGNYASLLNDVFLYS